MAPGRGLLAPGRGVGQAGSIGQNHRRPEVEIGAGWAPRHSAVGLLLSGVPRSSSFQASRWSRPGHHHRTQGASSSSSGSGGASGSCLLAPSFVWARGFRGEALWSDRTAAGDRPAMMRFRYSERTKIWAMDLLVLSRPLRAVASCERGGTRVVAGRLAAAASGKRPRRGRHRARSLDHRRALGPSWQPGDRLSGRPARCWRRSASSPRLLDGQDPTTGHNGATEAASPEARLQHRTAQAGQPQKAGDQVLRARSDAAGARRAQLRDVWRRGRAATVHPCSTFPWAFQDG